MHLISLGVVLWMLARWATGLVAAIGLAFLAAWWKVRLEERKRTRGFEVKLSTGSMPVRQEQEENDHG